MTNENLNMPESYHPPYNIRHTDGEWVATIQVTSVDGIHARPAGRIRDFANTFPQELYLSKVGDRVQNAGNTSHSMSQEKTIQKILV